jgi:dipeptidyl aminopeptidase/acylaminoacyl peptidase
MNKNRTILFILLLISAYSSAQKTPLDNTVYDSWRSLSAPLISDDGKWITYTINPQQGDGWLYIYNVTTGRKDSVERGGRAIFSPDNKYLTYQIVPALSDIRQAKKKKLKEDKMPKNDLEMRLLSNDKPIKVLNVKSFGLAEKNSDWMAYLLEKKAADKKATTASDDTTMVGGTGSLKKTKTPEPAGTELVLYNPVSGKEHRFQDVTDFSIAGDGKTISFLQSIPDSSKIEKFKVNVFDTKKEISDVVFEGQGSVKKLSTDRQGDLVSFLYSSDTAKVKIFSMWVSRNSGKALKAIDSSNPAMPKGRSVSENGNITFSDDGTKIYFGTAAKPVSEPKDTLLEDEKYKLDIWSWTDDVLQPMQKKQLEQERKRTWQAVYHVDKGTMFQLADSVIPSIRIIQKGNNAIALGYSDLNYRRSASWDGGGNSDYYIVNVETGIKTLALEKCSSRAYLSPSGKHLLYWDSEVKAWFSLPVGVTVRKNLTLSIKVPLDDELNDMPDNSAPYGIAGWMDDEKHVLVYDRYDIWSLDLYGTENPVNITSSFGRNNHLRLRYNRLDPEAEFINRKDMMYLSAFNYDNKESGFYSLKPGKPSDPVKLIMDKVSFPGDLLKAKKADLLVWQKGSYTNSPELYLSNLDFGGIKRISITNPQQEKYNWGTAELVEWMSFDHKKLQGILYKPENFDPARKYPMIVYFYERSSDGLYSYMPPAPSASIINRTFAVSNGYLVFVPDIPYVIGYPGQSCYNAVVSGTYSLLNKYAFIDSSRLGLDGQSWGGYQIAYLVTQTDLFACAYAGAAVSDMISAYGGIRWGTGMSRMFQYEKSQSRIGGTLWDKPVHFIENSPIFFVPKINTPLLLMHNDADDAVPWYQSIEFITALRRLDKPAWLLSYNDESHNLVRRPNRKDISIRKMQFFDHYLKGAPMPYWMKYGISQTEKGKIDGYNLLDEPNN